MAEKTDYEIEYYYIDRDTSVKYYTIEAARAVALELSRRLRYYPTIQFVATVV